MSQQQYEVPIIMKAVFDYIDTFSSRLKEMELQRKLGIACKKEDKSRTLENFLSRFPTVYFFIFFITDMSNLIHFMFSILQSEFDLLLKVSLETEAAGHLHP